MRGNTSPPKSCNTNNVSISPRIWWLPNKSLTTAHRSHGTAVIAPPAEDCNSLSLPDHTSQRPSIHDLNVSRPIGEENFEPAPAKNPCSNMHHASPPPTQLVSRERQRKKPIPTPEPQQKVAPLPIDKAPASVAPATQLVARRPPRKRKQPHPELQSQRLTRSSAKKMEAREGEMQTSIGSNTVPGVQSAPKFEPISSPRKKLKATGSPKKKKNSTPPPVVTCPEVQKSLIVKLSSPRKHHRVDTGLIDHLPSEAAGVRRSLRKAGTGPRSSFKIPKNVANSRGGQPQDESVIAPVRQGPHCAASDDSHLSSRTVSPRKT